MNEIDQLTEPERVFNPNAVQAILRTAFHPTRMPREYLPDIKNDKIVTPEKKLFLHVMYSLYEHRLLTDDEIDSEIKHDDLLLLQSVIDYATRDSSEPYDVETRDRFKVMTMRATDNYVEVCKKNKMSKPEGETTRTEDIGVGIQNLFEEQRLGDEAPEKARIALLALFGKAKFDRELTPDQARQILVFARRSVKNALESYEKKAPKSFTPSQRQDHVEPLDALRVLITPHVKSGTMKYTSVLALKRQKHEDQPELTPQQVSEKVEAQVVEGLEIIYPKV